MEKDIALYAAGNFAPLQDYVGRVSFVDNAGITLPSVTKADSGTYVVVVNGLNSGGSFLNLNNSAIVNVDDCKLKKSFSLILTI